MAAGLVAAAAPAQAGEVAPEVARIKQSTDLPVIVGFGINTPEAAQGIASVADATSAPILDFLADTGIRVNCITPGLIETDITAGKLSDEKKAEINATIPLARLGRADDIAGACVFLASPLSTYCTGITLDVNGGMLIH